MSTPSGNANWARDPDLLSGDDPRISDIGLYEACDYGDMTPYDLAGHLPRFDHETWGYRLPHDDCVLVGLKFHELCRVKIDRTEDNAWTYIYKPITEVGLSWIDFRSLRTYADLGPGDRGLNLMRCTNSLHWVVDKFETHCGTDCLDKHRRLPYKYAYGTSKIISEEELVSQLDGTFKGICASGRSEEEVQSKTRRRILLLGWSPDPDGEVLHRLGLNWFHEHNVVVYDVKKLKLFRDHGGSGDVSFTAALKSLGIAYKDPINGEMMHCAGNFASLLVFIALAVGSMDEEQRNAYRRGVSLPALDLVVHSRSTWRGRRRKLRKRILAAGSRK